MRQMKDSGIEWIGDIPQEWKYIKFNQAINRIGTGLNPRDNFKLTKEDNYYYVTIKNFKDGKLFLDDNCDRISKEAYDIIQERSKLQKGDILYASISKEGQAYILQNVPVNWNINESVFCIKLNHKIFLYNYFYYILIDIKFYDNLQLDATGTTFQSIKQNKLKTQFIPLPPLHEQQRIADFLDKKCSKIDDTIEKENKVIERLKEYKQSIISEAVTKGLDKNAPMKDSGIEWIGDIPQEWEIRKLKYLFQIKKVIAGKVGYDILSVTQSGIKIKDISHNEGQIAMDYSKYQLVDKNDFIMNHMDLLTGYVDCSNYVGVTSPDYRVFNSIQNVSLSFYKYIFQMCYKNKIFYGLGQGVSGIGRWRLPSDMFLNFSLPICNFEEQVKIANFLETKCSVIDGTIVKKQKLIDKLTEYKKSLIYEAVTGKNEV